MRNPALFSRIFNTPLMIHPTKLDAIVAGISGRWGLNDYPVINVENISLEPRAAVTDKGDRLGLTYWVNGKVGVIQIVGILAHRGGIQADSSFILGYDHIQQALAQAINDKKTESILLEIDTPGGEVDGAFELAAMIKKAGKTKPIKAVVSSMAASAGYLLASGASEIVISETGNAGSIGVVMRHIDISKAAEIQGVSVTYIYAGDKKVDGNPFQPLPESVKADLQTQIDKLYSLFVTTVSQNRTLSTEAVRAQQAAIYTGQDAITAGLADRISTPDEILAEMQTQFSSTRRSTAMSDKDKTDAALEQQAQDKARAEGFEAGKKEGKQEGVSEGQKAERERIGAILNHAEAKGRESQAIVMALETDMTAEQAGKLLAASPKTAAPAAKTSGSALDRHMEALGNPKVGAGGPGDDEETDEQLAANVVALHNKVRGKK